MVKVGIDLKGIVRIRTKSGTYYYAWRHGPRLRGEPGSPEFMRDYGKAKQQRDLAKIEALLLAERTKNRAEYLAGGRRFQSLTDVVLTRRWIKCLRRQLIEDRRRRTELDDLGGELSLRNISTVKLPPDVLELIDAGPRAGAAG
jgi:hypothetical protein